MNSSQVTDDLAKTRETTWYVSVTRRYTRLPFSWHLPHGHARYLAKGAA